MDQRDRYFDFDEVLATVMDAVRAKLRAATPVMVSEDSKDGHTVSLQPTTKAVARSPDGSQSLIDLPVLADMPIHHAGGGGFVTTMPHKRGNYGWLIPSGVSIDDWHQQGGIQGQSDTRMHALGDGVYVPGVRPDPDKLQNVSTTSAQTRTDDHKTVSDWSDEGVTHAREQAVHNVNAGGVMSALKNALLTVTSKGIAAAKGGSSHVVVDGAVSSLASKVLLNC